MDEVLKADLEQIDTPLGLVPGEAAQYILQLAQRPVAASFSAPEPLDLPATGIGALETLKRFNERFLAGINASAGPRYWAFVTGGVTPAALMGDWLASTFDQNSLGATEPGAQAIERETIRMLRQLFGLSGEHSGAFVTGATMSNFVGLAIGRQWAARRMGVNAAEDGLQDMAPIPILSGAPHSTAFKAISMLGMGRRHVQLIPLLPGREAVDVGALQRALEALRGAPAIVIANAGTVNSVDFDDLEAIAALKAEHHFWLHIDAAFGAFAAVSPRTRHLVAGLDAADSITVDAHKWLNVPYDSAMQFTRRPDLQAEVFQNNAAYIGAVSQNPDYVHLTPESSRRLRALPAWFTLMAYGLNGYREVVERDCDLASRLGKRITASPSFRLLAPVRMNVVCFTLAGEPTPERIRAYLEAVRRSGAVFMTPTTYLGMPGIRAAFSNWRTTDTDVDVAWTAIDSVARQLPV